MAKTKTRYGLRLNRRSFTYGDNDHAGHHAAGLLIEQLRYTGIVSNREGENEFVIPCPEVYSDGAWTTMNRDRMASFGIRATIVEDKGAGRWEPIEQP